MKALGLALLVMLVTSTGCFATWATVRATGLPGAPDESVREESVPQPGVQEHLIVTLADGSFHCATQQQATDMTYRSAYRYGKGWKKTTAIMFALEAALATATYFAKPDEPGHVAGAVLLGVDAIGTAALFFAPRKEVYSSKPTYVTTAISEVCPAGLAVEVQGETYPIDARGSVGEIGQLAVDDWMRAPGASLLIDFMGQSNALRLDIPNVVFTVPAGTLAQVALP